LRLCPEVVQLKGREVIAMSIINAISTAVQSSQGGVQNDLGTLALKQAAQAEKLLAELLEQNAKAAQVSQAGKGRISIYV
jgi:hypothetical protein